MALMRLFTCIYLSDAALDHLELAVSGLGDSKRAGTQQLRWVPREQRHITLAFHGQVPDGSVPEFVALVGAGVVDVEPFEVSLSGGGSFSGRTLFTGVADGLAPLRALALIVEDAAEQTGFRVDSRAGGRPHLTLARAGVRRGVFPLDDWAHALALYRGPLFAVDQIHVVESELGKGRGGGPLHRTIATVPLGHYQG